MTAKALLLSGYISSSALCIVYYVASFAPETFNPSRNAVVLKHLFPQYTYTVHKIHGIAPETILIHHVMLLFCF